MERLPNEKQVLEDVAELEHVLFPDNNMGVYTLRQEMLSPESTYQVEYCNRGQLIGYCFGRTNGGIFDIMRIGVRPSHQRLGLGTQMLTTILTPYPLAMLSVVKNNKDAIRLYSSLGFKINGDLGVQWVMKRDVNPGA